MNETMNYKEFELIDGFSVREGNEYNFVFKNGKPFALKYNKNAYNKIFDFRAKAESISMKKDKVVIEFIVPTKKYNDYDLSKFHVNVGHENYGILKKSDLYMVEIPYDSINISGRSAGIYLEYIDANGFKYKKKFLAMENQPKGIKSRFIEKTEHHDKNKDRKLYYSDLIKYDNHSIFLFENWKGLLSLTFREVNITDSLKERIKIKKAFRDFKKDAEKGKNTPSVLLYEKFCGKYEESARYVYERLIDDGCKNVYFILSKDSQYQKNVPEKYRGNLIEKNSLKHYYEYFNAKAFITTESMNHVIDLATYNPITRIRQYWNNYYYIFLQHGVMFAYSLKGRWNFEKGEDFGDNSYVVVSSETEANHFIEDGNFDREDLIKCGLPKFDHCVKKEDADKILIMPTSRSFEHSVIRDDTENSTYYNFSKKLIENVPEELKDKIIFIPHPVVNEIIGKTDLEEYMPEEYSYDELLKDTRLLITDYSSIAYDAFYRGSNLIFAWMEKEMCLNKLGIDLKLNDDNAFADIAYDYDELGDLITKNYYGTQSEENIEKYRDIVEFHDAKNTDRFFDYIYSSNIFPEKAGEFDMEDADVEGVENRPYTSKSRGLPKLKLSFNGRKLVRNLDFKVKYKNNKEIGTAECKIKGLGIYKGTKIVNFEIKQNIKKAKYVEGESGGFCLMKEDTILKEGIDYTFEVVDYSQVGVEKIVVKGIGEYAGKKSILIDKMNP